MEPYILYGDRRSGSCTAEMALAEIGAPVELRPVPLEGDHQLSDEYRRINPMGRVPAMLLPDGTVLTESLAILLTLADRHPEAALLPPPGDPARARALRWMALAAGEFYPHVTRVDYPERFSADPSHAPAIRERAREMGREIWLLVEREARPDPFILGSRFSAADIYLSVLTRWMGGKDWIPAHCPRLEALTRAVAARPGAGPVWRKHFQPGGAG
ncbi:Glutathione S-transferase [Roseomonas mucosa]|uniref:Glutathione S-transferase n=1 Tax=Roseomonas mucosa TaxID=207340 RepID=A0A1S8D0V5_9PROT|nr:MULTISPECIES: glutathione S-transferase family protein [Roseomonas]MBS5901279.1 glutathione S-transferase family protein [Acetobacteraceae bacterium]MCG7353471.1 glutathione S-transferase family protein [Roseomonas mucosa]MCG7355598.1 glutathione S-transferase family protein [Roseomonas mucosa]MDT8288311.1 glutathione S-transferase family protein [Roseomonas mucosa]MDT8313341.1 glutathione S-transferase family protein [Roseomonas mucosa]